MKYRVAHVITTLELGGAQQNTLYTVAHLDRKDFTIYLAYGPEGVLHEEAARIPGLHTRLVPHLVRPIRPRWDVRALLELYRWFRAIRPHIVHTHSSKAGILGRWAAYLAGVPIVIHSIHGFGITPVQPVWLRGLLIGVERLTGQITTRFIAVSRQNARWGRRKKILPARRTCLIRSGVELDRLRRKPGRATLLGLRRRAGIPADAPLVGMVACLKPQKAPLDFVRMARMLHARRPEVHYVLIGDGVLRSKLEAALRRWGLAERFHLLGWRRDVHLWLHTFDCLVLTSRWEGLPRVIPEALAAGVPVVATAVDGTVELLRHRRTGFLVRPGAIRSLARYVAWVLDHPDAARSMARRAAPLLDEFDIRVMVRKQERLYRYLLRRHIRSTMNRQPVPREGSVPIRDADSIQ